MTVYEASDSRFSDLAKAITHNETAGATIKPVQALVGEKVMVHGTFDGSERVDPASLPDCDVLQLDCEGAEREILDGLKISPRNILVETHGFRGAPTDDVRDQLESRGYQVTDEGVAEPRLAALCEERDIRVLAAERKS